MDNPTLTLLALPPEILEMVYRFVVEDKVVRYCPDGNVSLWGRGTQDFKKPSDLNNLGMLFASKQQHPSFKRAMIRYSTIGTDTQRGMQRFTAKPDEALLVRRLKLIHFRRDNASDASYTCYLIARQFFSMLKDVKSIHIEFSIFNRPVDPPDKVHSPQEFSDVWQRLFHYFLLGRELSHHLGSEPLWLVRLVLGHFFGRVDPTNRPYVFGSALVPIRMPPVRPGSHMLPLDSTTRHEIICDFAKGKVNGSYKGTDFSIPQRLGPFHVHNLHACKFRLSLGLKNALMYCASPISSTDYDRCQRALIGSKALTAYEATADTRSWDALEVSDDRKTYDLKRVVPRLALADYEDAIATVKGQSLSSEEHQRLQDIWNTDTLPRRSPVHWIEDFCQLTIIVLSQEHLTNTQVERVFWAIRDVAIKI